MEEKKVTQRIVIDTTEKATTPRMIRMLLRNEWPQCECPEWTPWPRRGATPDRRSKFAMKVRPEKEGFPKDFDEMSREELLDALWLAQISADTGWRIAAALAKEKLIAEKRYLSRFVNANK